MTEDSAEIHGIVYHRSSKSDSRAEEFTLGQHDSKEPIAFHGTMVGS